MTCEPALMLMGENDLQFMAMWLIFALVVIMGSLALRHRKQEQEHKVRLLAMEKGIPLPPETGKPPAPWTPRVYLLRGLLWLFTGIALTLMCVGISITSAHPVTAVSRANQAQYLKGRGASESEVQQYLRESAGENRGLPLGFAFVGLVPIGVGIAYLIFYRTEGRRPDAA